MSIENDARDYDSLFDQAGAWQSPPQSWPSPESAWEQSEFWAVFESCLDKLPANTARAFTMREVMGCDTDEVCEELKITEANCWVMLYRARMSLKLCLERKWFGGKSQRG